MSGSRNLSTVQAQRIALVLGSRGSSWISCRTIVPNIQTTLRRAIGKNLKVFFQEEQKCGLKTIKLAKEIIHWNPDKIIFADHRPHPENVVDALVRLNASIPPLYFYIYGDFTLFSWQWQRLEKYKNKINVKFICASEASADLVKSFLKKGSERPEVLPFPVSEKDFNFSSSDRSACRSKLKIKRDEFLIVYSGRMSLQKNCLSIMRILTRFMSESKTPVRLVFAGPFDDMGAPFFGVKGRLGEYFKFWQEALLGLPQNLQQRISYLGQLDQQELKQLYCAGDLMISFSLHHDEDYGMSPAEALMCGSPVLLTSWGGFNDFAKLPQSIVNLVDVEPKNLVIKEADAIEKLRDFVGKKLVDADRLKIAKLARSRFSIATIAGKLPLVLGNYTCFKGYSSLMAEHVEALKRRIPFAVRGQGRALYDRVYQNYLQ